MVMVVGRVQDGITHIDPKVFPTANIQSIINKQVGAYLCQLRMHQALTFEQAARKFNSNGGSCTPDKWRGWEQGNYRPGRDDLIIAAKVLKQNPSDLIRDINAIGQEIHALQEESMAVPAQENLSVKPQRTELERHKVNVTPPRSQMQVQEIPAPKVNVSDINLEEELDPEVIVALRLAAVIKRARASLNATSADIAELLNLPAPLITKLERGTALLSADLIQTVCTTFDVDPTTYQLQAGFIPTDIINILRRHPDVVAELRTRFS